VSAGTFPQSRFDTQLGVFAADFSIIIVPVGALLSLFAVVGHKCGGSKDQVLGSRREVVILQIFEPYPARPVGIVAWLERAGMGATVKDVECVPGCLVLNCMVANLADDSGYNAGFLKNFTAGGFGGVFAGFDFASREAPKSG